MEPDRNILLFTDFGTRDAYVAQLKGAILSINPRVALIDLTHDVPPFDIRQAAYLLGQATRYLPSGSIVVAVVDPGVGSARHPVLIRTQANNYYIGPDNGLFTRVLESELLGEAYVLQASAFFLNPEVSATFHGRDIFGPVAAHLSLGIVPRQFGPYVTDLVLLPTSGPTVEGRTVQGEVAHIDRFGNVVTNITAIHVGDLRAGCKVSITLADISYSACFCTTYADGQPAQLLCLFNSDAAFELALSQGNASTCLAVKVGDRIVLTY